MLYIMTPMDKAPTIPNDRRFRPYDAHVKAWNLKIFEAHRERQAAIHGGVDALHHDADGQGAHDTERQAIQAEGNGEATPGQWTDGERAAFGAGLIAASEARARAAGNEWPNPLDFAELAQRAPEKPQFILRDWLPAGYATLLAGHGGVGKSAIGLLLAVCIALGILFFGIETGRRRVLYLSCEDREQVLHWRLAHICNWLGIDLAGLAGELDMLDLVGHDTVLWQLDPRTGYTVTPAFNALAERMKVRQTQVLVVDGVSDAFGGNENARTEVKRFVNALLALIPLDGALLLLGHVAKPAATTGATSEGYSGSTQWHNAVRARWYLYPETETDEDKRPGTRTGKLLLELQKSNLGRIDQSLTFQWDDDAHLFVATGTFGTSVIDRKHRDETEQLGILRALAGCAVAEPSIIVPTATRGERTAFHVLSKRPEFPESLQRSTRRFWSRIEELRQLHQIDDEENRRSNRKRTWHFVLTPQGCARCAG